MLGPASDSEHDLEALSLQDRWTPKTALSSSPSISAFGYDGKKVGLMGAVPPCGDADVVRVV